MFRTTLALLTVARALLKAFIKKATTSTHSSGFYWQYSFSFPVTVRTFSPAQQQTHCHHRQDVLLSFHLFFTNATSSANRGYQNYELRRETVKISKESSARTKGCVRAWQVVEKNCMFLSAFFKRPLLFPYVLLRVQFQHWSLLLSYTFFKLKCLS